MIVHDNGKLNVLAENRCANTSIYRHFNIPVYSQMRAHNRIQLRSIWKQNPSEKIIVLRHPYQRVASAMAYHGLNSKQFYHDFIKLPTEEQQKNPLFWSYQELNNKTYEEFRAVDIASHCRPYLHHLIGYNFRYINFDRISEYLDVQVGPITNTTSKEFNVDFLEFFRLDDLKFEKRLYDEYLHRFQEISPEEWKEKTLTA